MITYMVVWMKRHSRELKGSLEGSAAGALAAGSTVALVGMAFLAVLREGFETSVFLLAAFQESSHPARREEARCWASPPPWPWAGRYIAAGCGSTSPSSSAATGVVLVLVAAGLLATSLHTGHEAGWFNVLQGQAVDLRWLVEPGSIIGSLLTGSLGIQPAPTVIEALGYLLYAVPMTLYVLWPDRRRRPARRPAQASGPAPSPMASGS